MKEVKSVLKNLVKKDIRIFLDDNEKNIKLVGNISSLTKTDKDNISACKNQLIDILVKSKVSEKETYEDIKPIGELSNYPISDAQRRLWILSQFQEESVAYNMPSTNELNGSYNIENLKKAIGATIERHEILRTIIKEDEKGEVRQWILPKEQLNFEINYYDFGKENKEQKIQAYIKEDLYKPFDLEEGPLFRASLLKISKNSHLLYFNLHHIISDGWSMEVLKKDVLAYYKAYQNDEAPNLSKLRIQYKDYAIWQRNQLNTDLYKSHEKYWLQQLSGELPLLTLPTNKLRPKFKTYNGYNLETYISAEDTKRLKAFNQEHGGSLFVGLQAVLKILLYKYTSQKDIIIGTPVAGRDHINLENQIGFYVNTLALRDKIDPNKNFEEIYNEIKKSTFDALTHQVYPFDRLIEGLDLDRDPSHSPVFDVMLTLQNIGVNVDSFELKKERINQIIDGGLGPSKFDLSITFQEVGQYISFHVNYNTDVYDHEMIEGLMIHYKMLLSGLLANPGLGTGRINYLTHQEQDTLLSDFNNTVFDYPKDKTIVDVFRNQVKKTPENIALSFQGKELTYKELDALSNQLAYYLKENYNIKPDDLIGIQLDRSDWLIVSILGILKSGGAYVPIDPYYPQERIDYIKQDSNCKLSIDIDELSRFQSVQESCYKEFIPTKTEVKDLAYVIYTSGSTGKPKGVMIEHESVINLISCQSRKFDIKEEDNFVLFSSISFDASVEQLYLSLFNGAKLHVPSKMELLDKELFLNILAQKKISHLHAVPAFLATIEPKVLPSLKRIVSGGDFFDFRILKRWNNKVIYNEYGPTETTVTAIEHLLKNDEDYNNSCIGRPISNTQVYILSSDNGLQPIGVVGEICIGGSGLARGYLNREDLTAEKFITHPFIAGERLYKTGDLGRWLSDGTIEFLGRKDDQVKIRGYRIELGEIEYQLQSKEDISSAVVLVSSSSSSEKELIGYVVSDTEQTSSTLRAYLQDRLPDYMLPSQFIQLDSMPLTTNGKVDKKSLLALDSTGLSSGVSYVAPQTVKEKILVSVLEGVLKREGIGIQDSFYNLGGDSIKSIQVVSRLKQQGYSLKVSHLLRTPVISDLAIQIEENTRMIDQSSVSGSVGLTPIQHCFFKDSLVTNLNHYNQSVLLNSREEIDHLVLEQCITALVSHHDVLRMVYKQESDGSWEQYNQEEGSQSYSISYHDLREASDELSVMGSLGASLQESLDLESGLLFQIAHFRLSDGDRVALIIHHLVIDGVSWRILLDDLTSLYSQYVSGGEFSGLPFKTDSFQRWSSLQEQYAQGPLLSSERSYWESVCETSIPVLPSDKVHTDNIQIDGVGLFRLDKDITELLQTRVHGVYQTEINDILLTGLGLALRDVFGMDKSVLQMEGHGREEIIEEVDISRTLGWFTSVYPFVLDVSGDMDSHQSLIQVKESLRKIPNKGIGYGMLRYLSEEFSLKQEASIVFNYLGDFGSQAGDDKTSIFDYSSEHIGSGVESGLGSEVMLDVSGMLVLDELSMSIRYCKSVHHPETIEKLTISYKEHLTRLINEIAEINNKSKLPKEGKIRQVTIGTKDEMENETELSYNQIHYVNHKNSSGQFRVFLSNFDSNTFENEVRKFIGMFPVLSVKLRNENGKISQEKIDSKEVKIDIHVEKVSGSNKIDEGERIVNSHLNKPFDLYKGALIRIVVLSDDTSNNDQGYMFLAIHHVLTDAYTNGILEENLKDFFNTGKVDTNYVSNFEYVPWQQKFLNSNLGLSKREYWSKLLKEMPVIKGESKENAGTSEFIKQKLIISKSVFDFLQKKAVKLNLPLNALFLSAHHFLLENLGLRNKCLQGIVINGREQEIEEFEVDRFLGVMNNILPLPIEPIQGKNIKEYVYEVYGKYFESRLNQEIPYEQIREDLHKNFEIDINELLAGSYNFQLRQNSILKESGDSVKISYESSDRPKGIHLICLEYSNAIEVNLICSKSIYEKMEEELSIETFTNQYFLMLR